ncbi:MAG: PQQ-dependent sugar dehydrogenase, partial [Dehalococcoidia bacterium]|nr:PQQ-dependent sugar dehydrogenase [Dehalococcoidia bacterium]
ILLGIGDHEQPDLAPRLDSIAGKIVRIDRDGNPLPDNPFVGQEGADPRIYAYGLRNPFGIAVDQASGRAYFTDNRTIAGDAVYELVAGADYGWPAELVALREPLVIYEEPTGISGVTVYQGSVLSEFTGDILFCGFHNPALHWSEPEPLEGFLLYERDQIIALGCSTGVIEGADGFVYFLSYNDGKLVRISR